MNLANIQCSKDKTQTHTLATAKPCEWSPQVRGRYPGVSGLVRGDSLHLDGRRLMWRQGQV